MNPQELEDLYLKFYDMYNSKLCLELGIGGIEENLKIIKNKFNSIYPNNIPKKENLKNSIGKIICNKFNNSKTNKIDTELNNLPINIIIRNKLYYILDYIQNDLNYSMGFIYIENFGSNLFIEFGQYEDVGIDVNFDHYKLYNLGKRTLHLNTKSLLKKIRSL